MTATSSQLRTIRSSGDTARWVLGAAVVANLLLVQIMFFSYVEGRNTLLNIAKYFGLHAAFLMMLQLTLVARLPWLDRRLGMDRLTVLHRWVGFALLWTVVLHVTFILLGYSRLFDQTVVEAFVGLAGVIDAMLGIGAAATVVVVAALSAKYARRRLSYEAWHAIHLLLYAAVVLALLHQLMEPNTFTATTATTVYWALLWTFAITALIAGRVVLPLWRNARHQLRVAEVTPEADDVVSVRVTGRDLDRLPARAGQFFIWRFPGHQHWWRANPFSMSAAPDGQSLRLTAKAVGDTSAGLRHVPVGNRVFAEGPYGAFTTVQRTRDDVLLIAGGVGITPIRAMLEELVRAPDRTGSIVVLYRARTEAEAVLLDELRELADAGGAQLHVLTGRTSAENSPFAPPQLQALVPDITERDVFVCGPPAMMTAVLGSLRQLNVPRAQVHAEQFSLA